MMFNINGLFGAIDYLVEIYEGNVYASTNGSRSVYAAVSAT